jgi:sugar/nucleoside kinase (ribokinase family)
VEALTGEEIVSFASIFVSPLFGPRELEELFSRIKARGCTLCADMTRCKNGETARDMAGALQYVDYLFPNEEEAALLTGKDSPEAAAAELVKCGAGQVVMTLGSQGCLCKGRQGTLRFPPSPAERVVNTNGAGDAFAGGFLRGLSLSLPLEECVHLAADTARDHLEGLS